VICTSWAVPSANLILYFILKRRLITFNIARLTKINKAGIIED